MEEGSPFPCHSENQVISNGLQRRASSDATLPQVWQEYFIAASFSLHIWAAPTSLAPQKEQDNFSMAGLQRCPGSSATAPQVLHV